MTYSITARYTTEEKDFFTSDVETMFEVTEACQIITDLASSNKTKVQITIDFK